MPVASTMNDSHSPSNPGQTVGHDQNFHFGRAKDYVELHDQVQTNVDLLDSLEEFLSTFQKDLSSVSGQISELQNRSKDIDNRLKSRRRIEEPLSNLFSGMTIPPDLALTILDSNVGEPWISAVLDLERRLNIFKVRARVKAAKDLAEVAEGLRIVAATKLRAFFLALLQPMKNSMATNMQVIQTAVFLKYRSLYTFLLRQAPTVAQELQKAYISTARTYYETGFRRYIRSLGWIKARTVEKAELIVSVSSDESTTMDLDRLAYGKIEGPAVILAYMADDKAHKEPIEAILWSLLLVLMDNATTEYNFVTNFFLPETPPSIPSGQSLIRSASPLSASGAGFDDGRSVTGSGAETHAIGDTPTSPSTPTGSSNNFSKEERASLDAIWKQILDPVLVYCQAFVTAVLEPIPPIIPLLTMIRLTEDVVAEVQRRECAPLESFIFGLRLQMWPLFQKVMSEHIDALKKLAEGATSSYFSRAPSTTDATVLGICNKYVVLFNSFVFLTEQEEETMIFSNLSRLRQELMKLIARHTDSIADPIAKATKQSSIYEVLLQGLSKGMRSVTHPKAQKEMAFWADKEEETRRRIISVNQSNRK